MKVRGILRKALRLQSFIAGVGLLLIMAGTFADVVRRQVLDGRSIPGVIEYSEVVLVAVVFLGLANTQRTGDHVAVDLLTRRLPVRITSCVRALGMLVAATFLAWMTWRSLAVGINSYQVGEYRFGLARVPIWPARLLIPLGLFFLVLQVLVNVYDDVVRLVRGEVPVAEEGDHGSDKVAGI